MQGIKIKAGETPPFVLDHALYSWIAKVRVSRQAVWNARLLVNPHNNIDTNKGFDFLRWCLILLIVRPLNLPWCSILVGFFG